MKKLVPLVIIAVLLALTSGLVLPLAPKVVAQQSENRVGAQYSTYWIYDSPEDTFVNDEVAGRKDWHANIGSGAPLPGLTLTLDSTLNFDNIQKESLTTTGPPTYVWSFGDVPPGTSRDEWVGFGSLDSPGVVPITFNPGFDASRSADKTEFSAPGTQTLTITVTPREATERFSIVIHADENDLVNPVITSPTSGDGIELKREGHSLTINPTGLALNTTWTITVTIEVTPKAPEVKYLPYIAIGWREPLDSGTASGNSFSLPVADMGTWTASAESSYEWNWTDELIRQVCWHSYSGGAGKGSAPDLPEGNLVRVNFIEEYHCWVSEDSFTNAEVAGERCWRTNMRNDSDETKAPVTGLKLTLDSEVSFEELGKGIEREFLTTMGPPTYEWFLGDIPDTENVVHTGGEWSGEAWVSIDSTKDITEWHPAAEPGYDVSRSFDNTEFSAPGIQTMTITVIPREESIDEITIFVHTEENNFVNPVVTSYSCTNGGDVSIEQEGHRSGIHFIPVELDTPVTIIVTVEVTPKVDLVHYKAGASITPTHLSAPSSGTTVGSSVSFTNYAGTWTWSAEGDYIWQWSWFDYVPVTVNFHESVNFDENALPISVFVFSGIAILIILAGLIIYRRRRRRRVT